MGWLEALPAVAEVAGKLGQYDLDRKEAKKSRDWQEDMSSTAHQREVNDLRAAGLNPILSAGGNGASTPSGATATAGDIDLGGAVTKGISTAQQVKQSKQAVVNMQATERLTNQQAVSTAAQAAQSQATTAQLEQATEIAAQKLPFEVAEIQARTAAANAAAGLSTTQITGVEAANRSKGAQADWDEFRRGIISRYGDKAYDVLDAVIRQISGSGDLTKPTTLRDVFPEANAKGQKAYDDVIEGVKRAVKHKNPRRF